MATVSVRVRTYTGDVINSICPFMCSWCSVRVNFISRCSMPSGSWIPWDKAQVASNECVYQGNMRLHCMRLSTNFSKSILSTAYKTFLFVPDGIHVKVGRACSSNVYSVLRTKAEMTVYCCSRELLIVILVHTPILPRGLCYTCN